MEGPTVSIPDVQLNDLPELCSAGVHEWVTKRNDGQDIYDVCLRCGQQAHWLPTPPDGQI